MIASGGCALKPDSRGSPHPAACSDHPPLAGSEGVRGAAATSRPSPFCGEGRRRAVRDVGVGCQLKATVFLKALVHRDDGVLIQAIGVLAGLGGRLVARVAGGGDVHHALAAALAEPEALHGVLEDDVPGGRSIPEIDLQGAAVAAAERTDAARAFELGVIGDPVLAAVAVQVLNAEHRIGVRLAVKVLASLRRFGHRGGDIIGRLGGARGRCANGNAKRGDSRKSQERKGEGLQFAPLLTVLRNVFLVTFTAPLVTAAAASVVAFTASLVTATGPSSGSRLSVALDLRPATVLFRPGLAGRAAPHTLP